MDFAQENHNWNCMEDDCAEQSPQALGLSDAFRDPELLPRIGELYQVEIPPLLTKPQYLFSSAYDDFLVGLPISLMWIKEKVENIKIEPKEILGDLNSLSTREESIKHEIIKCDLQVKTQPMDITICGGIEVRGLAKLDLQEERQTYMHQQQHGGQDYYLVPGSAGGTWNCLEEASFVLGLYIFGKNLAQVKKFVESKKMGDILSYYYGKFYRSDSYNRWSECRKVRSRRCIYGQRIFTGSTQQELLSRLFLRVTEECQNTLTEVAKEFGEGKMLFEEYVFALKAAVGLDALVEAVGIGKGKQDLTGIALEPLKSNQVAHARPEIPVGKACSTLTPLEIINFLTGGYRLSKARSNDIFWEAVWPRLLARGWHSEQTNDHGFPVASRHSLVFLVPGIKKFSRRKLVKGDHYFDSVSDVLNKVALDPSLLELDIAEDKGCADKVENGWTNEKILDQGEFPDQQRHCYLKPRTPSWSKEIMKFTVVDTSLATGETNRVREVRSLPVEMLNVSTSKSDSEESDEDSSEDNTNESNSSDNSCFDQNKTDILKSSKVNVDKKDSFSDRENFENNALEHTPPIIGSIFSKVPIKSPKEQKAGKYDEMQPRKIIKEGHANKRTKAADRNLLAPVTERRRRIAACRKAAKSCSTIDDSIDPMLKQDEVGCTSGYPPLEEKVIPYLDPHQVNLSSTSSSSRGSLNITDECTLSLGSYSSVAEHTNGNSQSRTMIDLNIPFPQDAETEPLLMHDQASEQLEDSGMLKTSTSICDSTLEQPHSMNSRRQSTRNRPLTTKALEALACGFLSIKQKRRGRDDYPMENAISRPSRRARSRMRITEDFATGVMDFQGDEKENGVCKGNSDIFSEPQV